MEFFSHLLIGILLGYSFSIFFPTRRKSLILIGGIFSLLPDIDIIFLGLRSIEEQAEWYLNEDIPKELIHFLNNGLGIPIEHRGLFHSIEGFLFLGAEAGVIVYLLSTKKNEKQNIALVICGTISLVIHSFLDWGFTESWDLTKPYYWEYPRTYGAIYSLSNETVRFLNEISFLILFLILFSYYAYRFIIPNRARFIT
jgi:membrane-bound metal-dependent hydrolase YbcI (DUF457 family)